MAKMAAHGTEIGTVYFATTAKRYMSDGVILKNSGFGWKIGGKVKAEFTPAEAYRKQVEHQENVLRQRPALAAYRNELHKLAGLSKRWKLHAAVELMPDDPDGVWSEVCDGFGDTISADVSDIVELCRLYRADTAERDLLVELANKGELKGPVVS